MAKRVVRGPSRVTSRVSGNNRHGTVGRRRNDHRELDGKAVRRRVPRSSHADWHPAIDRRDPLEILVESSKRRVQHLIPIRYGRMLQSPFAFYRGAAAIMSADMAQAPATGVHV